MTAANIYVPQQGALSDLQNWVSGDLANAYGRLYVSNTPYSPTRQCSDYTEASFVGYQPISPLNWSSPFTNSNGKAESDSTVLTWTYAASSGTELVFGIYVTDEYFNKLLLVVPFATPVTLSPGKNTLTQVLQLTEVSEL